MKKIFNNKKILYFVLGLVIVLVGITAFSVGYYLAKTTIKPKVKVILKEDTKTKEALKALQQLIQKDKLINSEAEDYKENRENNISSPTPKQKQLHIITQKPKLVIIMDDMSFYSQVKALKKLKLKITPSFFPPSSIHPKTAVYAKQFSHYMVHFPMQATNPNFKEEEKTIHIDMPYTFILNRVVEIKRYFPDVRFVNNHTGSKFTSNYQAMNRLYKALKREGLIFVDSRTTSQTKAPIIAKQNHQILLSRDVFLDNEPNIAYIKNQLKKAIHIAKKRGYAVAICHPHHKTFEALLDSKNILKEVEVIYLDELYNLVKKNKISKF